MEPDSGYVRNLSCDCGGDLMIRSGENNYLYAEFSMEACGKMNHNMS